MKKSLAVIAVLLLSSYIANAQIRVAVYVTGGTSQMNEVMRSRMTGMLVSSNQYITIERSELFMSQVDKEHAYQQSGRVDDSQIAKLGKEFGAQAVCVVSIQDDGFGEKSIVAKLIDVETMRITIQSDEWTGVLDSSKKFSDAAFVLGKSMIRPADIE